MARFDDFWEVACDFQDHLRIAFMVVIFLFVLTLISIWFADEGTDAYAISILNFAVLSVLGIAVAWMNRVCAHREREYY